MRSVHSTPETLRDEFEVWLKHLSQPRLESELAAIAARLGLSAGRRNRGKCARAIANLLSDPFSAQGL
jgi:hypothetical protein